MHQITNGFSQSQKKKEKKGKAPAHGLTLICLDMVYNFMPVQNQHSKEEAIGWRGAVIG